VTELTDFRTAAREIFESALRSVDAREAVRRNVRLEGSRLIVADVTYELSAKRSGVYVAAIGKAAAAMAAGLDDILDDKIAAGVISGPIGRNGQAAEISSPTVKSFRNNRWRVFAGGHPLPNQDSLNAARAVLDLLKQANEERATVIFLVSGGGSAMIEWPADEQITLEDIRQANRTLIGCGATILEINSVRRAFSAVKGGGLAAAAPQTDQMTLIISDTNPGDEVFVASGPTLAPPPAAPDAQEVVDRYQIASLLPQSIHRAIQGEPARRKPTEGLSRHYVLLDNRTALEAAAKVAAGRGFFTEVAHDLLEQRIEVGCKQLLARLSQVPTPGPGYQSVCLISGGEFACPVRGEGIGGRNSETVLRCAIAIDKADEADHDYGEHVVVLSAGTDGKDGNSPAAGAIADETSIVRSRALGLNAENFLERSDSFSFLNTLGDAIMTGPSGTNVRDIRILLSAALPCG
jgi:glycerate 2-kinase